MQELQKKGLLHTVEAEVDPVLEITEITDRVSKSFGPALYFSKVKGSPYPVLINTFGSMERMTMALGVQNLDEIGARIEEYLALPHVAGGNFMDKLLALPKVAEITRFMPKMAKKAPCQEIVEHDPDLNTLPILHCWPQDGGRFITLPLVFTKDPETGRRNCGMYRMHVYDGKTTGMHWHLHKDGSRHYHSYKKKRGRMEVAVAIGADPATIYAATAPLPKDIDEMIFAGFLRKEPVEMVKCKTVDSEVTAEAELVFEVYIDPEERRKEGPFGDHNGY